MPFDMYGDVILTRDVTERGLRAGDVEFFDMTGHTVAVVTLSASALRLPTPAERPAAARASTAAADDGRLAADVATGDPTLTIASGSYVDILDENWHSHLEWQHETWRWGEYWSAERAGRYSRARGHNRER